MPIVGITECSKWLSKRPGECGIYINVLVAGIFKINERINKIWKNFWSFKYSIMYKAKKKYRWIQKKNFWILVPGFLWHTGPRYGRCHENWHNSDYPKAYGEEVCFGY